MSSPLHAFARAIQPVEEKATVGWLSDSTYTYDVPGRPGYIYVTMVNPGRTTIDAVLNLGVPKNGGMPVVVHRNGNVKFVDGPDSERFEAWLGTNPVPSTVGPHSHEFGAGLLDWVSTKRIKWFQVRFSTGLNITITDGEFIDSSGDEGYFPGGGTLLAAPPTADRFYWAKVLFDGDTNTISVVYGSEQANYSDLTRAALAAIPISGLTPLAGIRLEHGQTTPSIETDLVDIRPWISGGSGGGGSSFYQTVQVDGTPETQRAALDLVGGSGITLTPTDDGGGNRTIVSIAATGSVDADGALYLAWSNF